MSQKALEEAMKGVDVTQIKDAVENLKQGPQEIGSSMYGQRPGQQGPSG